MSANPKSFWLSAIFLIYLGITNAFADGWQVNGIWWNVIPDFNGTHQTICLVENQNTSTAHAVFDLFPGNFSPTGRPEHATASPTLIPNIQYKIFGWNDGTKPNPTCTLKTFEMGAATKTISKRRKPNLICGPGQQGCYGGCGNVCYTPSRAQVCYNGQVCDESRGAVPCGCACYVPSLGQQCYQGRVIEKR